MKRVEPQAPPVGMEPVAQAEELYQPKAHWESGTDEGDPNYPLPDFRAALFRSGLAADLLPIETAKISLAGGAQADLTDTRAAAELSLSEQISRHAALFGEASGNRTIIAVPDRPGAHFG